MLPAWALDPKYQMGGALVLLGHPKTRHTGAQLIWHLSKETARYWGRSLAGSARILGFSGAGMAKAGAAVLVPVGIGYGLSYAIAGKQGTADFTNHLSNVTSPSYWTGEWWNTVTLKSMR
jgi:hypothetical protein